MNKPDAESVAKWISPDRLFVEVTMVAENPDGSESTRADETESSMTPYETKHPLNFNVDADTNFLNHDELLMADSVSTQVDLLVIGL